MDTVEMVFGNDSKPWGNKSRSKIKQASEGVRRKWRATDKEEKEKKNAAYTSRARGSQNKGAWKKTEDPSQ